MKAPVRVGLSEDGRRRRNEMMSLNLQRQLDVRAFTQSRILPLKQFHAQHECALHPFNNMGSLQLLQI